MIKTIDKVNGHLIQKVELPDGKVLRYQTVAESSIGDSSAVMTHTSLTSARDWLGFKRLMPEFMTQPKAVNPQNNKGYRADRR